MYRNFNTKCSIRISSSQLVGSRRLVSSSGVANSNVYKRKIVQNNTTKKLMNKLIVILLILSSCTQQTVDSKKTEYYFSNAVNPIELTIIDSCEYLYGPWGNATILTHKGNCRFCKQRK